MTVFEALPNGIETGWKIGTMAYGTIKGNILADTTDIDVIVDEISSAETTAANMAAIDADTLLYARPEQLPTTDTAELVAGYAISDPNGKIYAIIDAGTGKNQDNGQIEHIELIVRQTASLEAEE